MKLPKIITRRRAKWTGLAVTLFLAFAMIESDAFWPSFYRSLKPPSVRWQAKVVPGGVEFSKVWYWTDAPTIDVTAFRFDTRIAYEQRNSRSRRAPMWRPDPYAWLPSHRTIGNKPRVSQYLVIPFWIPLVLVALPTCVFFYRDRKPKPGFCAKCHYDLAGLTSDTCPECGSAVATIASIGGRANDDTRNRRSRNRVKCASRAKTKLLKIITSRRAMWTGLAMILCLSAVLAASHSLWPSYSWGRTKSPVGWRIGVSPGGVYALRTETTVVIFKGASPRLKFESRSPRKDQPSNWLYLRFQRDTPIQWLARLWFLGMGGHGPQNMYVPLWIPLALISVPTGFLVLHHRKRKPGCCAKCRHELTGLCGDRCPECGTQIATTDSHKAPASAADGKSDEAGEENGVS